MRPPTSSPSTYGVQSRNELPVPNAPVTLAQVASSTLPVTPAYQPPVEPGPHTSTVNSSARPSWTTHSARLNWPSTLGVRKLWASSCTPQAPMRVTLESVGQAPSQIGPGLEPMP